MNGAKAKEWETHRDQDASWVGLEKCPGIQQAEKGGRWYVKKVQATCPNHKDSKKVWKEKFLKGMLSGVLMCVGVKPLYIEEICGFPGLMGYYCFLPGVHAVSTFLGISTPLF